MFPGEELDPAQLLDPPWQSRLALLFRAGSAELRLLGRLAARAGDPPAAAALLQQLIAEASISPDPALSVRALERWSERVANPRAALAALLAHPRLLADLVRLTGASRYLGDILARDQGLYSLPAEEPRLRSPRDLRHEVEQISGAHHDWDAASAGLRRLKRREYFRLGWLDICCSLDLEELVLAISDLADCLTAGAFQVAQREAARHFPSAARDVLFSVIALGKLGARELNYSSDIDLVFVADAPGGLSEVQRRYATRLGERLLKLLSDPTGEGRCYRVDMRLRPEGRSGALVRSFASFRDYYDRWADGWERQALIKARPVAGDPGLGRRFMELVEPVIYRSPRAATVVEELMAMRSLAQTQLDRRGELERNVKSGAGSIRDIEFTAQLLQLLFGQTRPELRAPDTLTALRRLHAGGLLNAEEFELFDRAYRFLRRVEHHLQLFDDNPVRQIPLEETALRRLALVMGYDGAAAFQSEYRQLCPAVQEMTHAIQARLGASSGSGDPFRRTLLAVTEENAADLIAHHLKQTGYEDADRSSAAAARLVLGPPGYPLPLSNRRLAADALPELLDACARTADPAEALAGLRELGARELFHRGFYQLFLDDREALAAAAIVAGNAPAAWEPVTRRPELLDAVTDAEHRRRSIDSAQHAEEIGHRLAGLSPGRLPELLQRYRLRELVRLAAGIVLDDPEPLQVSHHWSELADAIVRCLLHNAASGDAEEGFAVMALGRYGGSDLHFCSDLDLVYVFDSNRMEPAAAARRASDLTEELTRLTPEGKLYSVDLRLRPEGRQGARAFSLEAARRYYGGGGRAEPWEFQMLTRLRRLAGDETVFEEFRRIVEERIYRKPAPASWMDAISLMKRRLETERLPAGQEEQHLKLGLGGFSDIEFIVQTLQLQHGWRFPDVRHAAIPDALDGLAAASILSNQNRDLLRAGLSRLTRLRQALFLLRAPDVDRLPDPADPLLRRLAKVTGAPSAELLMETHRQEGARIRELLRSLLPPSPSRPDWDTLT